MDENQLAQLYQQYLGRAPDPSGIATWSNQSPEAVIAGITGSQEYQNRGGGGGGSAPTHGDAIVDPETGQVSYSNVSTDPSHVGYFNTQTDSEGNAIGQTWNPSKYDFTGATYDARANQYTMPDGSKVTYDPTTGDISNYTPNYANLTVDPSGIRQGYRNQNYAGPTMAGAKSYNFQGTQLTPEQVDQGEYIVDPTTNKYVLDKSGNPIPVYRQPSGGGLGDFLVENGWMLPLAMAGGAAAAEFLPGLLGSEVGMVDAAGNIIGAGAEGAAVGAGAGSSFLEQLAATQAAEDAAAGAAYPAGSVPTGAGLSGNVYGATGLDAILAEAGLSGLTGADLLKYGIPLGNLASRLTGGSGAASSLLGGLSGNTRPASALTGTTSGGYGSAINNYGSPKGTFVHGQQVAIPGMTPYGEPAQVANQQPYFNPQTLQEIQQAKNGGIIHKAGGGDLPMQEVRMRGRHFTMHQPHSGLNLVPRFAPGGSVPEGHEPTFFSPGGLASMENTYVKGDGNGTSDSVAAMLADGEFVVPADVVSKLGNGSNDAGAKVLDNFLVTIREHAQKHDPKELPPDSKGPLAYLLDAKKKASA